MKCIGTAHINAGVAKGLEDAALRAATETMDALMTEVKNAGIMPFDTGDMQNNQTFMDAAPGSGEVTAVLITDAPQARRLYYHPEYNFQQGHNAQAGAYWLDAWLPGGEHGMFVPETYTKKYAEEVRNAPRGGNVVKND